MDRRQRVGHPRTDQQECQCRRVQPGCLGGAVLEGLAQHREVDGGDRQDGGIPCLVPPPDDHDQGRGAQAGKDEPLPPSTIKASDLSFLFEIKMAGKAIISRRISGKQLGIGQKESYLEKGGGMIRSGKSFESFGWVLGETKQILDADNFRTEPFTVEVQMLTPERLCQLSIGSRRYIFNKDCVKSAVEDSDKFIYPGRVTQAERLQELRIRPSIIGSNVERRLKKDLHSGLSL